MKRLIAVSLITGMVLLAAGCRRQSELRDTGQPFETIRQGDLSLRMELSELTPARGERLEVTLRALNTGDEYMTVPSNTGAPAYVDLYRYDGVGWNRFKTYPEAATMVMNPWKLSPGVEWQHTMSLPVEPSWPMGEPIRVVGRLNGIDDVTPSLTIQVQPAGTGEPNQP